MSIDPSQLGHDEAYIAHAKHAVAVASGILGGQIGLIEGCRTLSSLAHDLVPDWRVDPTFVVFGGVNSETDHLPIGEPRKYWDPSALAMKDKEIAKAEDFYRKRVTAACEQVVERLGAD